MASRLNPYISFVDTAKAALESYAWEWQPEVVPLGAVVMASVGSTLDVLSLRSVTSTKAVTRDVSVKARSGVEMFERIRRDFRDERVVDPGVG